MKSKITIFSLILIALISFLLIQKLNTDEKDFISELMSLDGSYVGDASAVGYILTASGITYETFSLETRGEPFGITVKLSELAG